MPDLKASPGETITLPDTQEYTIIFDQYPDGYCDVHAVMPSTNTSTVQYAVGKAVPAGHTAYPQSGKFMALINPGRRINLRLKAALAGQKVELNIV